MQRRLEGAIRRNVAACEEVAHSCGAEADPLCHAQASICYRKVRRTATNPAN